MTAITDEMTSPLGLTTSGNRADRPVVAIIGGGFTGAALAYHLAGSLTAGAARIIVYEPRATLGAGLAYGTDDAVHRINVPAARMTLVPGDDEHFQRWLLETGALADDPQATIADGHVFARRSTFGQYVSAQLQPFIAAGRIEHRRIRAEAATPAWSGGWHIDADDGSRLTADLMVLATTHPSPTAPAALDRVLAGHPRYIADATVAGALSKIRQQDRVLVLGAGLTAADVIAALDAVEHQGPITAVSRRGLRSRGHNLAPQDPFGEFVVPPVRSAHALLRRVRSTLAEAQVVGVTWHAVFDRLRAQGGDIWRALPTIERRRVVRFLRPYWDVHRFRIAPQVEGAIDRRLAAATLAFHAASVREVTRAVENDEISVTFRQRHGRGTFESRYDAVIVTTGPDHRSILSSQPLVAQLATAGLLQADPVGLGIAVDENSRVIRADGGIAETLYVAGPLARGTFGELMGLPQVTEHAVFVAERIALTVRATQSRVGRATGIL